MGFPILVNGIFILNHPQAINGHGNSLIPAEYSIEYIVKIGFMRICRDFRTTYKQKLRRLNA